MVKEYTDLSNLAIGELYYKIGFGDDQLLSPAIVPMVYLGVDLIPELRGNKLHYFQDVDSYVELEHFQKQKPGQDGSDTEVLTFNAARRWAIYSAAEVTTELLECRNRWENLQS